MSNGDSTPWRSGSAEFDQIGFDLVKRDIEVLMLKVLELTKSLTAGQAAAPGPGTGMEASPTGLSIPYSSITGVPSIPPAGSINLTVDTTDVTTAPSLVLTGSFSAQAWTMFEKRPRFNAKWLQGSEVSSTAPTNGEQVLKYNATSAKWEPFDTWNASAVTGWLNCYDSTLSDDVGHNKGVMAGTALSVFGRASNTDGLPAGLAAAADNTLLGRRSSALTFAKVAKAEMADAAAVSVIGRSANSSGVTADIAGAANQALVCNGTPALAFSRTITLGDTSNAGSLTIGNATSATAIVLSPTLISAAGKVMSVREIDVCDAGVAKKMLILASAPY